MSTNSGAVHIRVVSLFVFFRRVRLSSRHFAAMDLNGLSRRKIPERLVFMWLLYYHKRSGFSVFPSVHFVLVPRAAQEPFLRDGLPVSGFGMALPPLATVVKLEQQ